MKHYGIISIFTHRSKSSFERGGSTWPCKIFEAVSAQRSRYEQTEQLSPPMCQESDLRRLQYNFTYSSEASVYIYEMTMHAYGCEVPRRDVSKVSMLVVLLDKTG